MEAMFNAMFPHAEVDKNPGYVKLLVGKENALVSSEKFDVNRILNGFWFWNYSELHKVALVSLHIEGTKEHIESMPFPNPILNILSAIRASRATGSNEPTQLTLINLSPVRTVINLDVLVSIGPYEEVVFEDMDETAMVLTQNVLYRLFSHSCIQRLDLTNSYLTVYALKIAQEIFCQNQCIQLCIDTTSTPYSACPHAEFMKGLCRAWLSPRWTTPDKQLIISPPLMSEIVTEMALGFRSKILCAVPLTVLLWHPEYTGAIVIEQNILNNMTRMRFRKRELAGWGEFFKNLLV
ncbi:hypothetical protein QR680_003052 [Steinernema hermaphroditum]|uniref:Uncharacterized protein n=1 Tax=Steinernema hermaphroditum TaxID=289476 RepID=A0AA39H573_9BILA|nr:hypothetical protein QR680_003052 [Steinernema hermaphroditum]